MVHEGQPTRGRVAKELITQPSFDHHDNLAGLVHFVLCANSFLYPESFVEYRDQQLRYL